MTNFRVGDKVWPTYEDFFESEVQNSDGPGKNQGLIGLTYDPFAGVGNSAPTAAGVIQVCRIRPVRDSVVTNILSHIVTTPGVSLTNSFAGLYDNTGARIGVSADQSTAWQSTGAKTAALTTPPLVEAGRFYYVAVVIGSAGTLPTFARGANSTAINMGTAAPFRCGSVLTGQTSLPSSITLANVAAEAIGWLFGLS